jgi:hypothetical protein
MRAFIVIAAATVALAACNKGAQTEAAQNGDETMTAGSIVSNDVTAIDAVTGDAANMAADVDMNFGGLEENGTLATTLNEGSTKPSRASTSKPSPTPESNSTANTTANAQ